MLCDWHGVVAKDKLPHSSLLTCNREFISTVSDVSPMSAGNTSTTVADCRHRVGSGRASSTAVAGFARKASSTAAAGYVSGANSKSAADFRHRVDLGLLVLFRGI